MYLTALFLSFALPAITTALPSPGTGTTCTPGTTPYPNATALVECIDIAVQTPQWGTYLCANLTWGVAPTNADDDAWSAADCVNACKACLYAGAESGVVGTSIIYHYIHNTAPLFWVLMPPPPDTMKMLRFKPDSSETRVIPKIHTTTIILQMLHTHKVVQRKRLLRSTTRPRTTKTDIRLRHIARRRYRFRRLQALDNLRAEYQSARPKIPYFCVVAVGFLGAILGASSALYRAARGNARFPDATPKLQHAITLSI
ncbi:hypothetical protein CC86DRAFT_427011 [Ophiobolus disseminans]|uniref:Uncharacterized protein n=1 Tax=Ophiobolus disseminans TaxID=1469910 RepID=A0A6A6ZKG1_9PLEO|nr:hypothetical protein CC86DRAFT_427011 [Ophiobolus disseminans]